MTLKIPLPKRLNARGFHVAVIFRWYDVWVGIYIDTKCPAIYIFPVPMLGIRIMLPPKPIVIEPPDWKAIRLEQMIDRLPKL